MRQRIPLNGSFSMEMFHDSRQEQCRFPQGAVTTGTVVTLRIFIQGTATRVTLRVWNGEEKLVPMEDVGLGRFEAQIHASSEPALMWYDFSAEDERGHRLYYGNAWDKMGGAGATYQDPPPSYLLTVYDPAFSPPDFLRDGIMYQIFPDRFHRSRVPQKSDSQRIIHEDWYTQPMVIPDARSGDNQALDFYGGDLNGIRLKLPYLKDLGITVLYLNPIFMARSNHRYDTGDYLRVDPLLGDEQALRRLNREAKKLGIRIILDGVFSHTGEDSVYFNRYNNYPSLGASQSKDSPYYLWYQFRRYPHEYASWWGIPTLPEINKNDPGYRRFMMEKDGVARYWIKAGISGWRLDVADELPMDFLKELRTAVKKEKKDAALIGEVWEDASQKISYGEMRSYVLGDTLDSVMNYPLREVLIRFFSHEAPAAQVVRVIRSLQENYPLPFFYSLMNLMGSHDRARILNLLVKRDMAVTPIAERGGIKLDPALKELAVSRLRKMLSVITALPGMPSLYYGDEAGMEGAADPFCRGPYPWGREDTETMNIFQKAFAQRRNRPVLRRGFLEVSHEGEDTLLIARSARGGLDAFGEALDDAPYFLRVTRDASRV